MTVLYVSKNTRAPDTPGSEPHLQRRQRDAALAAWERADALHDRKATEWQAVLDKDHAEIYKHAAARLAKIYSDKERYLHHKPRASKQHKKQLVQHCRKPWKEPFHRWQPHRSGYQRSACGERVHQALTATTIEERLEQVCPQLQLEASKSRAPQPTQANPEKDHQSTGHCQSFGQADQPAIKHPAYPRRNKRVSCINRLYDQPHPGHASHTLWQRGDRSHCKNCCTQTQTDAQNRPILRIALQKTCKGAAIISGSPPITEIFRRQTVKASQIETSHPEAGTPATASDTSQAHALLPEGHEPQPQSVRQAQRNTSETTSPLAPRQLIYSEATSAPRAPGLSDSQISQLPISELRYAGSLQAMTPSRLLACRSSCPHQWKATSLQHQRSSNSWLRSPRAHHKLLRPCWRRGPSRPGGLLLAGEVRLQAAAAAAPAKVPSCNSSKRHFRKNMHTCIHSIPFHSIPFHSIPFHSIHYITLHYITLHCIALHCITLHYITLHT